MRSSLTAASAALVMAATGLLLAACESNKAPAELTNEQVCLSHHENNPVEQDRCRQSADLRKGPPPDVRPQDLPLRSDRLSD